jgi:hypothetical protein
MHEDIFPPILPNVNFYCFWKQKERGGGGVHTFSGDIDTIDLGPGEFTSEDIAYEILHETI